MNHLLLVVEGGRNDADTAQYPSRPKPLVKADQMPHPVKKWKDCGVRPDGRREGGNGAVEIVRLATQKYEIEGPREVTRQYRRWIGKRGVAEVALDRQSRAGQFLAAPGADKKRDIPFRLEQPAAEIAAGRAGAHYESAHASTPPG